MESFEQYRKNRLSFLHKLERWPTNDFTVKQLIAEHRYMLVNARRPESIPGFKQSYIQLIKYAKALKDKYLAGLDDWSVGTGEYMKFLTNAGFETNEPVDWLIPKGNNKVTVEHSKMNFFVSEFPLADKEPEFKLNKNDK